MSRKTASLGSVLWFLCLAFLGGLVEVRPVSGAASVFIPCNRGSGRTISLQNNSSCSVTFGNNTIKIGETETWRAVIVWDTTEIPDTFRVTSALLHLTKEAASGDLEIAVFDFRAIAQTNCDLLWRFHNNTALGRFTANSGDTDISYTLPATANSIIETQLPANWFAIGLRANDAVDADWFQFFADLSTGGSPAVLEILGEPPTPTPTRSPTMSPTQTPTISPTPTITPTPSSTVSPSPTMTPTDRPTSTASQTPTASPTTLPTATYTPCPAPFPATPTPCQAGTRYTFSWRDSSPCGQLFPPQVHYEAEASRDIDFVSIDAQSGPLGTMFYEFVNLRSGSNYYYRARSFTGGSYSPWSNVVYGHFAVTQDADPPRSDVLVQDLNQTYCRGPIGLPYSTQDEGCGVDHVEFYASIDAGIPLYLGDVVPPAPFGFTAVRDGSYEISTMAVDRVQNRQVQSGVHGSFEVLACGATMVPTSTPTVTPSGFPTYSPTPSRTPTPSATPSVTPTMTPSLTPTVSPTPTMTPSPSPSPSGTPTETPSPSPTETPLPDALAIWASGYMSSRIESVTGGSLILGAIVHEVNGIPVIALEVLWQGKDTGLRLDPQGGGYYQAIWPLGAASQGRFPLELRATDLLGGRSTIWPYLTVEEGGNQ